MPRKNTIKKNPIRKTNKNNGRRLRKTRNVKQKLRKTMKKRGGVSGGGYVGRKMASAASSAASGALRAKRAMFGGPGATPKSGNPQDDPLKHLYNFLNTHMEAKHDLVAVKKTASGGQSHAGTYKAFILDIKREEKQKGGMFTSKKYEAKLENSDKYKLTEANLESYTEIAGNKINKLRSMVGMNGGSVQITEETIGKFEERLNKIKTAFNAEKGKFNSGIDEHSSPEVKEDFFNTIIENLEGIIKDAEELLKDIEEPMTGIEGNEPAVSGDGEDAVPTREPGAGDARVPGPEPEPEADAEQRNALEAQAAEAAQKAVDAINGKVEGFVTEMSTAASSAGNGNPINDENGDLKKKYQALLEDHSEAAKLVNKITNTDTKGPLETTLRELEGTLVNLPTQYPVLSSD